MTFCCNSAGRSFGFLFIFILGASECGATTRYVWQASPTPTPGYTSWSTAAQTIQAAVDVSVAGDEIVVTNGVYASGGRAVYGTMTNRVAIDRAVLVHSVNGPGATVVQGFQAPGLTNGSSAIRCIYLTNGASLSGFTITIGATHPVFGYPPEDSGGGIYCENTNSVVSNCVVVANACAGQGGGCYGGSLQNCTIIGNWGTDGGGAYISQLTNCIVAGNAAISGDGGGVHGGYGQQSTIFNCYISNNLARYNGGGVFSSAVVRSCAISGNSANRGGGAESCTLDNCTITGNSASQGGGVDTCLLDNCIVYYNNVGSGVSSNYNNANIYYSCTAPAAGGSGDITADPMLASSSHLSATSPCRTAGLASYAFGVDIDGETWPGSKPSMGCDQFNAGSVTGALSVAVAASATNVAVGFAINLNAVISGKVSASAWNFGDGTVSSNQPYASHSWNTPGVYTVVLTAWNVSNPGGVTATTTVQVTNTTTFVSASNPTPVSPYWSWATAATNIQDAIDAAGIGSQVIVSNGVYAWGGRAFAGSMTNRVTIDKRLVVSSVNGPEVTIIQGRQVPGTTNGDGAIRCVYLTSNSILSGFTFTNGATRVSGGFLEEQTGGGVFCESATAIVTNCVLTGNASPFGGGVCRGTINNCTLICNSAGQGGAAAESTLNNCVVALNHASTGGGVTVCTVNNCTITGNSALRGGGANYCTATNSIVYYNTGEGANAYDFCTFAYCCTTPLPNGIGNFSSPPQLASISHIALTSPCRGAGVNGAAAGVDIDAESWSNPPSIGCDEYIVGSATGLLSARIDIPWTNIATGYAASFTGLITGRPSGSAWDFGDGSTLTNNPYATHTWSAPGVYAVVLKAWNESNPGGITATAMVQVVSAVHYVSAISTAPAAPYTSWGTAAANIQDAVDAAAVPGALVLVTNGVYSIGARVSAGTMTNRLWIQKPIIVRSVNGPAVTLIEGQQVGTNYNGDGAIRCVYLGSQSVLSGFTLTNGATRVAGDYTAEQSGGGVWCESCSSIVSNCILTGNSAVSGGGAYGGTINNCQFVSNSAASEGAACSSSVLSNCKVFRNDGLPGAWAGAAYYSTLNNCTVVSNSVMGVTGGVHNNCIIYYNGGNLDAWSDTWIVLDHCCSSNPNLGSKTVTNQPLFVDAGSGDLRLQSNSPCINAGYNQIATGMTDLAGNSRIAGGTVDIGCYEFHGAGSVISYAWLLQNGLATDGSADFVDSDSDGLNNWQEWRAQTDPFNSSSNLRIVSSSFTGTNFALIWRSIQGVSYVVERGTSLTAFVPIVRNVPGQDGTTGFVDSQYPFGSACFYRVGVSQ